MPTIEISKKDLCSLTGKNLNDKQIEEFLQHAKTTIESAEGDRLKVEAGDANRPDLWSVEGIARVIKGQIGKETGMPRYKAEHSDFVLKNEGVKARPFIACAVVKNLKLDEEAIKQIIQLQEKLCENFGLRRREAALGIYDFDKIKWPIYYTQVKPDAIKFIPLEMKEAITPREILQKHEKGIQYKHLLENEGEYPFIIDSAKQVLSMPPIINSDFTGKVTEKTKNVFVEVTGLSCRFILPVLNVMVAALAERNGKIFAVNVQGKNKIATPDLTPRTAKLDIEYCNRILGLNLKAKEICKLLEKARFDARIVDNAIEVSYLPYRQDIMDARDIIEDVAIAYGYNNLKPEEAKISTIGKPLHFISLREKLTELLIGLQIQEVATFTLTNKDALFKKMNLHGQGIIEVSNPVSANYGCIRDSLIPSILDFLSQNTKKEFPQRIFEIGECYSIREGRTKNKLAVAITNKDINFTAIKQVLDYIMGSLNLNHKLEEAGTSSFIEGRAGSIMINNKNAGIIGEIHPKVLSSFGIEFPVVALEIDLDIFS